MELGKPGALALRLSLSPLGKSLGEGLSWPRAVLPGVGVGVTGEVELPLERAETWALDCRAGAWTHVSSSNKIQRNSTGLKITVCMCSQGKLWTTRYKKTKNPTATSEEPGAKAGHCTCPLHKTPPEGWADHLSYPSSLTPGNTSTLTPCKEPARPALTKGEQGNLLSVLAPPCCSRGPSKALPAFLVWPFINFC